MGGKLLRLEKSAFQFYVAGAASIVLGVYSFSLPKCPPKSAATTATSMTSLLGLQAFSLFRNYKMALFFIFAMLLGAALQLTNAYGDTFLHDFDKVDAFKNSIAVQYLSLIHI